MSSSCSSASKGVERLVAVQEPIEALTYTAAVAILIVALSLFRLKPSRYDPPAPTASGRDKVDANPPPA